LNYNEAHLCDINNDILLKGYGNLVQRVYKVAIDSCVTAPGENPVIPNCAPIGEPFDLHELKCEFEACFSVLPVSSASEVEGQERCGLRIRDAICFLEKCVGDANAFVDRCAPWKRKGPEDDLYRKQCARAFLDAVYCLTHFFRLFTPNLANRIMLEVLESEFVKNVLTDLSDDFQNLSVGKKIRKFDAQNPLVLVDPLESEIGKKDRPKTGEDIVRQKQEEKEKRIAQSAANKAAKDEKVAAAKDGKSGSPLDAIEVRVGQIIEATLAEGTNLFVEKVDVGSGRVIDVVSGIAEHYPSASAVVGRRVLIIMNFAPFKPKQLPNFESRGMLLAAKSPEGKVELVLPPVEAKLGERLVAASSTLLGSDLSGPVVQATTKQWDKAKHVLRVDENGFIKANTDDVVGADCKKQCAAETVKNGTVS